MNSWPQDENWNQLNPVSLTQLYKLEDNRNEFFQGLDSFCSIVNIVLFFLSFLSILDTEVEDKRKILQNTVSKTHAIDQHPRRTPRRHLARFFFFLKRYLNIDYLSRKASNWAGHTRFTVNISYAKRPLLQDSHIK